MTKRGLIVDALREAYKEIQKPTYNTDLYENVEKRFLFPEDNPQLPIITLAAGQETINYQPGGFQDRYLTVVIRAYIEDANDSIAVLEDLIQDIEAVTEKYSSLTLSDGSKVRDIKITLIDTDQGVLAPLGTTEIQLIVEY